MLLQNRSWPLKLRPKGLPYNKQLQLLPLLRGSKLSLMTNVSRPHKPLLKEQLKSVLLQSRWLLKPQLKRKHRRRLRRQRQLKPMRSVQLKLRRKLSGWLKLSAPQNNRRRHSA